MSNYAISLKRTGLLLAALAFTALLLVVNLASFFGTASAADLTARSVALSSTLRGDVSSGVAGSATNSAAAVHTFRFTVPTAATSATFTYCTSAIGDQGGTVQNGCTVPTGLVLPGVPAATDDQGDPFGTAAGATNRITWTAAIPDSAVEVSFAGITNPTSLGTFFVRIVTDEGDDGTVASAITEGIQITARVAETLGFSTTGDFAAVTAPTGACTALGGSGAITLGDPTENTLSLTQAYDNYSAFRIYTNASGGVAVQYHGDTLRRNVSSDIDQINLANPGEAAASAPGTEQFGLAIDVTNGGDGDDQDDWDVPITSSSTPLDFTFVDTTANLSANGALTPTADYGGGAGTIVNAGSASFAFLPNTPTSVATSAGYVECKTAAVRYIANINPTTSSGTYTTTIVYSAVPTY